MKARRGSLLRAVPIFSSVWALAAGLVVLTSCSSLNSQHVPTQAPVVMVAASVSFGSIPQGITSSPMTLTLTNTGTASLTFTSSPAIKGTNAADFAITSATCSTTSSVAVNGTCTVTLTFKPSTMAAESASLTFADNAPNTPQSVSLMGTGTAPAPLVSLPASLSFGLVLKGVTSPAMTVTLMNIGSASLTFPSGPNIMGANAADFAISGTTCGTASPVAANGSCTVTINFMPSTTAAESASLNFVDNAANSPQSVSLTGTGTTTVSNVLAAQVNSGPPGVSGVDTLFVSVTICVPGSTTMCQTIPEVEVDTGSSGLRLLASAVTLSLPQSTDPSGNPIGNCVQFADMSFAWGPVQLADILLAGEKASAPPIQLINQAGFPAVPASCMVSGGMNITDSLKLGANGILGVGEFRQDCGSFCANPPAPPAHYYSCVSGLCSPTTVPLLKQLQNPVWMFPQDNNGVLIMLPSVPANGQATLDGSLIFGIGTQPNNMLGSATIYTTDAMGNFTANFKGVNHPGSFVDSGSNGFFFLDTATTSLPACKTNTGFYCPASATSFTVTNTGANGASAQVMFSIANADTLFSTNPTFSAFSNIGGPFPGAVDYGLPFFIGRSVFTGIEGQPAGGVTGPFFAF